LVSVVVASLQELERPGPEVKERDQDAQRVALAGTSRYAKVAKKNPTQYR
jgi:hypothetical protein